MLIKSLKINNLRNLSDVEIAPDRSLNLLLGHNGAGKTSVLESVILLAKGKSFRSGGIDALLGPDGDSIRCFARIEDESGREHRLGLERNKDSWKGRIDGTDVQRFSELSVHLPFVLIEPNSHQLVSGTPETRRRFIDWGVFHVKHTHLEAWRRYARAIKQRNAALRQRNEPVARALEPQLASLGEQLDQNRRDEVHRLADSLSGLLAELSPELQPLELGYESGWRDERLADALARQRDRDLERGQTWSGPHRADLRLRLPPGNARDRLSRGEQKIVSAALLLSQAQGLLAQGVRPLMFLDDIASEFDGAHLESVLSHTMALECQVWITGTEVAPLTESVVEQGKMFHVKHGQIMAS